MLSFRKCRIEDEKVYVELNKEFMEFEIRDASFWNDTNDAAYEQFAHTFHEALEHPELVTLFMIEMDNQIIGFMNLMTIYSIWSHGKALILDDLFIKPKHQNKGVGRSSLDFVESFAREQGYKRLQFFSEKSNEGAYAFYTRLGFEPTEMYFYVRYLEKGEQL